MATASDTLRATLSAAAPYLPMSAHLILSALAPIYTGSHASLSRPSSAAAPPKKKKKKQSADSDGDDGGSDSESSDEPAVKMEGLAPSDAVLFPLIAGATLAGLFFAMRVFGAALVNHVLRVYFAVMGYLGVGKMLADALRVLEGLVFPGFYTDRGGMWMVRGRERVVERVGGRADGGEKREQPLPGRLGRLRVGEGVAAALWTARELLSREYRVRVHVRGASAVKARLTLRAFLSGIVALGVVLYANFIDDPWYLTNLQGFAFSYSALQILSPATFGTGSLVLAALFFYDIYFVFYTPIMVSVATNLDVPIKMLFPRPDLDQDKAKPSKPSLAMLGLGDIVLPGIMIGLCLRFDLYLHYLRRQKTRRATRSSSGGSQTPGKDEVTKEPYVSVNSKWGERIWTLGWNANSELSLPSDRHERTSKSTKHSSTKHISSVLPRFRKTYFHASMVGYVVGMGTTLVVMQVFRHAQPALLYLVPAVLGAVWLTALARGEVWDMWAYSEFEEEEDDGKKKETEKEAEEKEGDAEKPKSWLGEFFGASFFAGGKMDRTEARLRESVTKRVEMEGEKKGSDAKKADHHNKSRGWFSVEVKAVKRGEKKLKANKRRVTKTRAASISESGSDDAVLVSKEEVSEEPWTTAADTETGLRRSPRKRKA